MSEERVVYTFAIDTDTYAGNFERQMTAYITGRVGECGVGKEEANDVEEELDEYEELLDSIIDYRTDSETYDHSCFRPCTIVPTPGWINDGNGKHIRETSAKRFKNKKTYPAYMSVGIFLSEYPSDEIIELLKSRAKTYNDYVDKKRKEADDNGDYYIERGCGKIESFRLLKTSLKTESVKVWIEKDD